MLLPRADSPPNPFRTTLCVLAAIAVAGLALGWNKGELPRHEPAVPAAVAPMSADRETSPDLQLYRAIIADVRNGRDYYDSAEEHIPRFGFPIGSPLNWRLPTYAWLLSCLPNKCWIQAVLLLLGIASLGLAFAAERIRHGSGPAALTTLLLLGVFRWALDGEAYLAQEVWAGILLVISVSAHALGATSPRWRILAAAAGILALTFRELALPYCLVAGGLALWHRRWFEAALWSKGLALFTALLVWHVLEVQERVGVQSASGTGLAQWLRCGGLDFVLLTVRMNGLLFAAPAAVLWLYLVTSLFGLAQRHDETSRLCCLSALWYLVAFAFLGRPENFYWGLVYAPLLPWGIWPALSVLVAREGCAPKKQLAPGGFEPSRS
ncbi:MAG: hypothetical protein WD872_05225 [Pirellulaceae bacterium]